MQDKAGAKGRGEGKDLAGPGSQCKVWFGHKRMRGEGETERLLTIEKLSSETTREAHV